MQWQHSGMEHQGTPFTILVVAVVAALGIWAVRNRRRGQVVLPQVIVISALFAGAVVYATRLF